MMALCFGLVCPQLSAIEVDPTTNCSTPFDPSRLDDLSSDSDDEYFDVVQLPGLRPPPQPPSARTPSTSPLPQQQLQQSQQARPSQGNASGQEPPRVPPTHSQSMPAVNKGIASGKMGNTQPQPPSTATDSKQQPVNTTQLTQRISADTANIANAINILAPTSNKSKAENSQKGENRFKAESTYKAESTTHRSGFRSTRDDPMHKVQNTSNVESRPRPMSPRKVEEMPRSLNISELEHPSKAEGRLNRESGNKTDSASKTGFSPKTESGFRVKEMTNVNVKSTFQEQKGPKAKGAPELDSMPKAKEGMEIGSTPRGEKQQKLEDLPKVEDSVKAKNIPEENDIPTVENGNGAEDIHKTKDTSKADDTLKRKGKTKDTSKTVDTSKVEPSKTGLKPKTKATSEVENVPDIKALSTEDIALKSKVSSNVENVPLTMETFKVENNSKKESSSVVTKTLEVQGKAKGPSKGESAVEAEKQLKSAPKIEEEKSNGSKEAAKSDFMPAVTKMPKTEVTKKTSLKDSKLDKQDDTSKATSTLKGESKAKVSVSEAGNIKTEASSLETKSKVKAASNDKTVENVTKAVDNITVKNVTKSADNTTVENVAIATPDDKTVENVTKDAHDNKTIENVTKATAENKTKKVTKTVLDNKTVENVTKVTSDNKMKNGTKTVSDNDNAENITKAISGNKTVENVTKAACDGKTTEDVTKATSDNKAVENVASKSSKPDDKVVSTVPNDETHAGQILTPKPTGALKHKQDVLLKKDSAQEMPVSPKGKVKKPTKIDNFIDTLASVGEAVKDLTRESTATATNTKISEAKNIKAESVPCIETSAVESVPIVLKSPMPVPALEQLSTQCNTVVSEKAPSSSPVSNDTVKSTVVSPDSSTKKETTDSSPSVTTSEKTNKRLTTKTTEPALQPASGNRKVRAGSPVPGKSAVVGLKITPPVVTGKLQITPSSGPGPPDTSTDSSGVGQESPALTKETESKAQNTLVNTSADVKSSKKVVDISVEKMNTSSPEKINASSPVKEEKSCNKTEIPDSLNPKIGNGVLANSELDATSNNKLHAATLDQALANLNKNGEQDKKIENGIVDGVNGHDDFDDEFSEIESLPGVSRRSSVASDTSRTMSPDGSYRSKRKSEKLSAIMNLWENEDVSQISERSKPPRNKPKVGKITGLKNMFEAGKAVEKAEPLSSPNLAKLKAQTASSAAITDPKAGQSKRLVAGSSGIASMNAAKFGGTSKFKKPPECSPSDGDKILKRERSTLSNKNDKNVNVKAENKSEDSKKNEVTKSGLDKPEKAALDKGEAVDKSDHVKNEVPDKDVEKEKLEKDVKEDSQKIPKADTSESKDKSSDNVKSQEPSVMKESQVNKENVINGAVKVAESSSQSTESGNKDTKKKKKKKEKVGDITDAKEKKEMTSDTTDAKEKKDGDKIHVKIGSEKSSNESKPITDVTVENKQVESSVNEPESAESKTKDNSQETVKNEVSGGTTGKDIIGSTDDAPKNEVVKSNDEANAPESKSKGSKKLGGIKSFIETVAKGGKTLEDKLSKTGIHVGKRSTKIDNQKESPTLDSRNKKNLSLIISPDASTSLGNTSSGSGSVEKESTATGLKTMDDTNKSRLEYKQTLAKAVPALESEVEALIKEASVLLEPGKAERVPNSLPPRLTLPKPIHSVASFPDTPLGGELCVTSLPASPTKEKKGFDFGDKHRILSLPASPTKEVHFHFEETTEDGEEEVFVDAIDPGQLDTLMPLPDVINERDIRSRSRTPMDARERSITPSPVIAESEAILSETDRLLRRSRSNKSLRRSYSRSLSSAALNRLSEVSADLSEEHTTAHLAGERLEAEQAERMKLEKEIDRLQTDVKRMTSANGKLEMEKLALRSEVLSAAELNGDIDDDEAADASLYKRKYEWCLREIELLKKQSKQQQEDDLDQLLLLKKQLEKKVADAYEETDEQRQVVAQLKRKCQRLQAEMNDLKILLEEQTSRNNLLEKKQRKFDQEMMSVQEELRHERANKDKIQRERDQILSEKYSFEQEVTTLKLELELKEEKVSALNRELDDLTSSGKVEEEVATLKKAKHDLEMRIKDQEEELDDLAGQVQMLEGAKVRLEMSMEQMRKENRREMSQREEELEDVRISAQKKVKSLEAQLENEHEERTLLVREKHELERRIADLQDRTITHVDEDYVHKLKKELKKTKALLRDTQTMLEKAQSEGSHKLLLRQLKTQLEDAEFAKTAALKARQCAESDLSEVSSQLDETLRAKKESEERCARVNKERAEIQTQLEESEEEVAEVMKKYKAVVSQLSVDQITLSEQSQQIAELEHTKQVLQERMLELSSKVEVLEGETANIHTQRRLEMKIKEVESKLELELTTRQRLESQIGRLKDQIERLSGECDAAKMKETQALDQSKRLGRQLRDAKEDLSNVQQKQTEAVNKKSELEKQLELSESEVVTLKSDLKLAFKRIEDLQQAIQGDISDSDSDLSDSDSDSDGSLSSYLTASLKQQRSSSNSTLRTPPSEVQQLERLELPNSPCSEAMSAISEDLDDASNKESFA